MNRLILLLLALFLICNLSACRRKLPREPAYPYKHIKTIAVCPVLLQPNRDEQGYFINLDSELLGRILAEEWTKFSHDNAFKIIFPRETAAKMVDKNIAADNPNNIRKIGRLLKADAVCLVQLNHYQPYTPKSCTLTFQLYLTSTDDYETQRIVNISQLGSDLIDDDRAVTLAVIQRRWDGNDEKLRERARRWSNRLKTDSTTQWRNTFKIEQKYFRFIFNATLRDYITDLKKLIIAEDKRRQQAEKEAAEREAEEEKQKKKLRY